MTTIQSDCAAFILIDCVFTQNALDAGALVVSAAQLALAALLYRLRAYDRVRARGLDLRYASSILKFEVCVCV